MSDQPDNDRVLGTLGGGEAQTSLSGAEPPPRVSRRKSAAGAESERLPRGIWLRLRVSGGLVFRSSQTVVFSNGKLVYDHSGIGGVGKVALVRELAETEQQALRAAVVAAADAVTDQPPTRGGDMLVYEIDAKLGRRTFAVAAAAYALPDALAQVVQQLGDLVRVEADELYVDTEEPASDDNEETQ